jgi:hypothetical protein
MDFAIGFIYTILIFKRIVFVDFIHRLVSQEQKIKKLKIIDKRLKPEQIKTQTSTNKSHRDQLQTTEHFSNSPTTDLIAPTI